MGRQIDLRKLSAQDRKKQYEALGADSIKKAKHGEHTSGFPAVWFTVKKQTYITDILSLEEWMEGAKA